MFVTVHMHQLGVVRRRNPIVPVLPLATTEDVRLERLTACWVECDRLPDQRCVVACCGARPLREVCGWATHACPKRFWPAVATLDA